MPLVGVAELARLLKLRPESDPLSRLRRPGLRSGQMACSMWSKSWRGWDASTQYERP